MGGYGESPLDGVDYHQIGVHRFGGSITRIQYILIMRDGNIRVGFSQNIRQTRGGHITVLLFDRPRTVQPVSLSCRKPCHGGEIGTEGGLEA